MSHVPTTAPGPAGLRPARPTPRPLDEVVEGVAQRVVLPAGTPSAGTRGFVLPTVSGVVIDNRAALPDDLFVALPGARVHGARFAADAVARGAVAVLTDDAGAAQCGGLDVPVVVADDPRAVLGEVAARVHGRPAEALATFGVTGTNGKTTTTYVLDTLLAALGRTTGLVGTVETRSAGRAVPSALTTPEAGDLQALLATMREDGVDALAMEVSSHALALHRVDAVVYDVAGFTNLSQDHLDFHGDLDSYFSTKATLFAPDRSRRGVVVLPGGGEGRAWAQRLLDEATVPVVALDLTGRGERDGWTVLDVEAGAHQQEFRLVHADGRSLDVTTTLPGGFNLANVALAVVMVLESGVGVDDLAAALTRSGGVRPVVPGRMETVGDRPRTVVDFAHNPDALALALDALRPTTAGRLVVVFGATGERDRGKRPIMGRVAVERADVVIVTDDDPHGEPAGQVRAEVLEGARAAQAAGGRATVVREAAPRARAIRDAVLDAGPDDTVLVAGRGHEVWQEIDGVNHPLDDRVEARAALADRAAKDTGEQDA
ncbi:UDP-N-acetylmuramoylalanyl-D-glutamate--2,6-diaminopimelate ligase [Luteimicrobium subarcticum]|uniref:UDP-N-acetylmuramyl-tripeptide synthetase n=1 Tax=Luteimicrobium subarcticum TaxID=620910 RepID=A0A2M8WTR7_9MICO|nr:UDP-N-acetylmuramoyl-L-alanyl-D-glutamate--2,6-diaminopimelate ligase [Luteimicrobium subarcticum]PJI94342.1 UDP-N-acetylmuramoylalanyl-D-glutamate--2,6-diaminopimelate ligase [Luteimicrobium subarcticum]